MVTTAAHQGTLQNSTLGAGELCRGLREAGEGRLDAAVDGHRDQGPETRLQRPMTRDQRPEDPAKTRRGGPYQVSALCRCMRSLCPEWSTLDCGERSPRVAMDVHDCTPEPFSLYEEREQPEEDRKTCTGRWEDSNTGRWKTGTQEHRKAACIWSQASSAKKSSRAINKAGGARGARGARGTRRGKQRSSQAAQASGSRLLEASAPRMLLDIAQIREACRA